jgi:hypothetical protein
LFSLLTPVEFVFPDDQVLLAVWRRQWFWLPDLLFSAGSGFALVSLLVHAGVGMGSWIVAVLILCPFSICFAIIV